MGDTREFCLTLDLEDDWYFDDPEYDHLTLAYLDDFIDLIDQIDLPISVFVVGDTLERHPDAVDRLDERLHCDFHLHSYQHDTTKNYDFKREIQRASRAYFDYFGESPVGYRAPQGNITAGELRILEDEGFLFDSSIFPSYRPGVFNNLRTPIEPYTPSGLTTLLEIPIGVFRGIRIPTGHNYFKLFGRPLSTFLTFGPLPKVVVYNVHLQDIFETPSHAQLSQPKRWVMRRNLDNAADMLKLNIARLRERGYEAKTMTDLHDRHS